MKIKAGYRLEVLSWENDGDNYNTKVLDGLSIRQVQFFTKLCKMLKSKNSRGDTANFGNMYAPSDEEVAAYIAAVRPLARAYVDVINCEGYTETDIEDDEDLGDRLYDFTSDLIGNSEYYYHRVVESFSVQYVPEDIELQDVTNQFK